MDTSILFHGKNRGIYLVIVASILWGTSGVASQAASSVAVTNPLSLSFFRMVIAAPILLFTGWYTLRGKFWPRNYRDLALILLVGVLTAIDQALYFVAISYAGVTIATLITICSAPILVTVFTARFERKPINRTTIQLIALALVGTVLLISGSSTLDARSASLPGILFSVAAGFVYAVVIFLGRFLASRCDPLQVTAIGFSAGAALLFVVSQATGFAGTYPVSGWLILLYMGAIPTALAYGMFHIGMRTTPAPVASIIVLLEPLTAAILAWLLLGDGLNFIGLVGAGLLLFTIYKLSVQSD